MSALPRQAAVLPFFLKVHWTDRIAHAILIAAGLALAVFLLFPLAAILVKSVQNRAGDFIGLQNFADYFRTPALARSIWNSLWVSSLVTAITIPLAFTFAYALTRSCMRFKPLFATWRWFRSWPRRSSRRSPSSSGSATRGC